MKFKANRRLFGDQGQIEAGQVFGVHDSQVKRMQHLEAKGLIERYREPRQFKAYTVYENKAIVPGQNKSS